MNIRKCKQLKLAAELIAIPRGLARRFRGFGPGTKSRQHHRRGTNALSRYLVQALRPTFGAKKQIN